MKYLDKEVMEILKSIQSDMKSMRNDISRIDGKLENVENKTDKNTLLLEDLNRKVQTIAEVDSSLAEQLDREKHKDNKSSDDRLNIIELAVTDTSSRVKDIQKDLSRVVRATGEN